MVKKWPNFLMFLGCFFATWPYTTLFTRVRSGNGKIPMLPGTIYANVPYPFVWAHILIDLATIYVVKTKHILTFVAHRHGIFVPFPGTAF